MVSPSFETIPKVTQALTMTGQRYHEYTFTTDMQTKTTEGITLV